MMMRLDNDINVTTKDAIILFNGTGAMSSLVVKGKQLLDAPLEPYFWKPENDNQHAAHFAERTAIWKDATEKRVVKNIRTEEKKDVSKKETYTTERYY